MWSDSEDDHLIKTAIELEVTYFTQQEVAHNVTPCRIEQEDHQQQENTTHTMYSMCEEIPTNQTETKENDKVETNTNVKPQNSIRETMELEQGTITSELEKKKYQEETDTEVNARQNISRENKETENTNNDTQPIYHSNEKKSTYSY